VTSSNSHSSSSSGSNQPRTIKIGFYGAGSRLSYGNDWLRALAQDVGGPWLRKLAHPSYPPIGWLYEQGLSDVAIGDLFAQLDKNKDRIITQGDIDGLTVKVLGYSWGGVSAVAFCQKLSQPGFKRTGGTDKNPIGYQLEVPIPIDTLVTIDPVTTLNPAGTVPSTVNHFRNYYQTIGGYAILRTSESRADSSNIQLPPTPFGNVISAAIKGTNLDSQAADPGQVHVNIKPEMRDRWVEALWHWKDSSGNPVSGNLFLCGAEVNHDVMPLFGFDLAKPWLL